MLNLYIRSEKKNKQAGQSTTPHVGFTKVPAPANYQAAVRLGQQIAGYGNFYVYLGESSFPSREDQLLLEPRKRRQRRRNRKLAAAQLLD